MRKQNSEFLTAFTSEADQDLQNTDSFAFVELDDLACYVIADGIDDKVDAKSARLAVDSVIAAFTEAPSIKKAALRRYMNVANQALNKAKSKMRLKASVTIVIHNYVKMRYAQAGNTRLHLYRDGFLKLQSKDQSKSMDLIDEERLEKDKLAEHQERNNLYCFLGQEKEFSPFISKKIKLTNSDAIALFTRGIWEHVDNGELADVFADASNEPTETVDNVEDVLLSKQPFTEKKRALEKYTFVVLFVNKTFEDPNRKRRIKRIIMIVVPILLLVVVLIVILVVQYNKRMDKIEEMNTSFLNAIQYIQTDNYIRAETECSTAADLAKELKDTEMQDETGNYLRLIESIIAGDDYLSSGNYEDALNQYQNALNQARYADNVATDYISSKLELTSNYMEVYDLIALGDTLTENLQYENAEQKYLQARALATQIYFDEGRTSAKSALEDLYTLMKQTQEESDQAVQEQAEQQTAAAGITAEGDKAFAEGDYNSALVYYQTALQKYIDLEDAALVAAVQAKIDSTQQKQAAQNDKRSQAEGYVAQAESASASGSYVQAKKYYLLAQNIYTQLKDDDKVAEISLKIQLLDLEMDEISAETESASAETTSAETASPETIEEISEDISVG